MDFQFGISRCARANQSKIRNRKSKIPRILADLADDLHRRFLHGGDDGLLLVDLEVVVRVERGICAHVAAQDGRPGHAIDEFVFDLEVENELAGGEHVGGHGARLPAIRLLKRAVKNRVGAVVGHDFVGAVLLELLDRRVGEEHLDVGDVGLVLEGRDRDLRDVLQDRGLGRAKMIAAAGNGTGQSARQARRAGLIDSAGWARRRAGGCTSSTFVRSFGFVAAGSSSGTMSRFGGPL